MDKADQGQGATGANPAVGASGKPTGPVRLAPYCLPFVLLPFGALAAVYGGWWVLALYVISIVAPTTADLLGEKNTENPDPATPASRLIWHRVVLAIWPLLQGLLIFGAIAAVTRYRDVAMWEAALLLFTIGVAVSGSFGPVIAHELIHRSGRGERLLGDALLGQMLYGHFRTEHIFVHHRYVGTPRDTVTARYGETIYQFLVRVLPGSVASAWRVETGRLRHRGLPAWSLANPFWIYGGFAIGYLVVAGLIGGGLGIALFVIQAAVAILYLEIINYIEHYGLERRLATNGRFEPVRPHHSWNSAHRFTNYLYFNLPRHPDHHYKPDRLYPLLLTYPSSEAPQMPLPYPLMLAMALAPPAWMKMMNKRVRRWREKYYPGVSDWPAWGEDGASLAAAGDGAE